MKTAPIALFVYNRLDHAVRTIEALKNNKLADISDLIIFSDAPKNIEQEHAVTKVRNYVHQINGFNTVSVIERASNLGLANSIISGVTSIINDYGRVIVIEDDIVTSQYFLKFMNDGLNLYSENDSVASIHGYIYPINDLPETFFLRGADCWGWATWKNKWDLFEKDGAKLLKFMEDKKLKKRFDYNGAYPYSKMLEDQVAGKNDSWAIRWYATAFLNNKYTLYPGKSLVLNIGNDGSGTHCGQTNAFSSELQSSAVNVTSIEVKDDLRALKKIESYFRKQKQGVLYRVIRFLVNKYRENYL